MLRKAIVVGALLAAIVGPAAVAWTDGAGPGAGMAPSSMMGNGGADQESCGQEPGHGGMMGNGGADQGSCGQDPGHSGMMGNGGADQESCGQDPGHSGMMGNGGADQESCGQDPGHSGMMGNGGADQESCGQDPGHSGMMGNGGADQGSCGQDPGHSGMMGQMGMSGHGMMVVDSEFGYLAQMIPHHEEAIASAEMLLRGTDRPELKAFAQDIIDTQATEVAQMRTWLATWYPGQDTSVDYDPMMRDLTGLTGDELDRGFLEDMIGHHMSAVMMSQQLLAGDLAEHQELVPFAEQIRDGQHAEIFRMSNWLADWFDESAMGPTGLCH